MAAARLSSAISSMFLTSRASSITCWPSAIFSPAFSNSNIIGGSMMSTPTGMPPPPGTDALLEIAAHGAQRRQRAAPVVAGVDVLGPDLAGLDGDLVHGRLLLSSLAPSGAVVP